MHKMVSYRGGEVMRIGIFTTSRADYGIFMPIINELRHSTEHEILIFPFGMHLSEKYGNMDQITYFLSIKNEILSASQTDDLIEIFFHLSSANFLGFDYPSDVTVLLNDLLDKSILLSETQNAKIDGVN